MQDAREVRQMKKISFLLLFLLVVAPVFADANLTINGTGIPGDFINTRQRTPMLNLTFNLSESLGTGPSFAVKMSYINVTINSTSGMNISNITAIEIINASGNVIAANTTLKTDDTFFVYFGSLSDGAFVINSNNTNRTNLIISINVSGSAHVGNNTRVNVTSNASFGFAVIDSGINVTLNTNQSATNLSTIVNLHANVSVTPRYVDTLVLNQTFLIVINVTCSDSVQKLTVTLPSDFTNVTIVNVKRDGDSVTSGGSTLTDNRTTNNVINITMNAPATSYIIINFTANTTSTTASNTTINATIRNVRFNASADENNNGVKISHIIIIDRIIGSKLTALPNGTDYWEFNFTLNFSANVSGGFMFRMLDWTDNASRTINVNTSSASNAEVRLDADGTKSANVTNSYNLSAYLPMTLVSTSQQRIALKMILPAGTATSSTWWSTYFMLFSTDP